MNPKFCLALEYDLITVQPHAMMFTDTVPTDNIT